MLKFVGNQGDASLSDMLRLRMNDGVGVVDDEEDIDVGKRIERLVNGSR